MLHAAFTVKAFGVYLLLLGLGLVLLPNRLLGLFGMPPTSEVWIRVVGLLAFNIGLYYWYAAKSQARPFFAASVYIRAAVPVVFIAFVVLGLASPVLVVFGIVDLAGGLWTLAALRRERQAA
ncbi:MAG: hypothetical protein ABI699_09405 [Caldimonas sp.]